MKRVLTKKKNSSSSRAEINSLYDEAKLELGGKIKMTSSIPGSDYTFGYFSNGYEESYMRPDTISIKSVQEKISNMLFIMTGDDLVFGITFENTSIDLSDFIKSEVYIKVGAVHASGSYIAIAGNSISWLLNRGGGTQSLFDQFLRQCGAEYDYTLTITPQTISTP